MACKLKSPYADVRIRPYKRKAGVEGFHAFKPSQKVIDKYAVKLHRRGGGTIWIHPSNRALNAMYKRLKRMR